MKNIAIDFDGTIHDFAHPVPGRKMGPPIEGSKEALQYFIDNGYDVIVFCRWAENAAKIKTIRDYMTYWQLPCMEITNIKPDAVAYIDDRGIRFAGDWKATIRKFEAYLSGEMPIEKEDLVRF